VKKRKWITLTAGSCFGFILYVFGRLFPKKSNTTRQPDLADIRFHCSILLMQKKDDAANNSVECA